jgi:hypothetical protein
MPCSLGNLNLGHSRSRVGETAVVENKSVKELQSEATLMNLRSGMRSGSQNTSGTNSYKMNPSVTYPEFGRTAFSTEPPSK